jgi:hypothetical protein
MATLRLGGGLGISGRVWWAMKTSLAIVAGLGLCMAACSGSEADDGASSESDFTQRVAVETVTDFLSSGHFSCLAEDNGGRSAEISISVAVPRKDRDVWSATGSYEVEGRQLQNTRFVSATRGRPIQSVTGGALSVRVKFGVVICSYTDTRTGIDGTPITKTFEGRLFRHSPECFNESYYLQNDPQGIAAAVANGGFLSGRMHFEEHGRREGRPGCQPQPPPP